MKPISEIVKNKPFVGWVIFITTILLVFLLGLFASSIIERRTEAEFAYRQLIDISKNEPRSEKWGTFFPREYQSYLKTQDTSFRSKYNGSALIDMLEVNPRMVILWSGYGFAKDYKQGRGHYYSVEDIWKSLRTGAPFEKKTSPMPNTCWSCKSPDVPRLMNEISIEEFYEGTWETKGHEIINPIGCADCHDSETMNLKITRPAMLEAFKRKGKDILKVSHQEMRSMVCAQCHSEYYFNMKKFEGVDYLTLPWDYGFGAEDMERYYDELIFSDWIHDLSMAPMLKAQHPDYEIYLTGIHASKGVSCADCHMPFISEGGQKFTDHHIQSPVNNVNNSCQVCHREEAENLIRDIYSRQDKIIENRDKLEELLVRAHVEAKFAWEIGATEIQMKDILIGIRHSQWRWDYVAASHGASFHSPVEVSRVIASGIVIVQETRIQLLRLLAELGYNREIPYPDISTKAKAQAYIGLTMNDLNKEKEYFIESEIPKWLEKAKEREKKY
ncbi:MAG: ammonia-forming cytochrome c nitrite reductase [Bacteroidales bacterium]|nr:ammonia-forming cytochrome c nitrite reductase [Bacteroidales bacterium]